MHTIIDSTGVGRSPVIRERRSDRRLTDDARRASVAAIHEIQSMTGLDRGTVDRVVAVHGIGVTREAALRALMGS